MNRFKYLYDTAPRLHHCKYPSIPSEEIDRIEFYKAGRLNGIHVPLPGDTVGNIALIISINRDAGRTARIVLKGDA